MAQSLSSDIPLTEEQLMQIHDHARDLLTWKDIAYLMDIPLAVFKSQLNKPDSAIHRAYHRGRVERKKQLRVPILKLAEIGSPQAEMLALDFLKEQYLSEDDD